MLVLSLVGWMVVDTLYKIHMFFFFVWDVGIVYIWIDGCREFSQDSPLYFWHKTLT